MAMTEDKDSKKTISNKDDKESKFIPSSEENTTITLTLPKKDLAAFDNTTGGKGLRSDALRDMMEKRVQQAAANPALAINYDKLKGLAEDQRREMEGARQDLKKNGKLEILDTFVQQIASLEPENIPVILERLLAHQYKPDDGFTRDNVEDYIRYLEAMQQNAKILADIDAYRKAKGNAEAAEQAKNPPPKLGKRAEKNKVRYIPPSELCTCGIHETKTEHNQRCRRVRDEMLSGVNRFYKTGEALFEMIKKCGAEWFTSTEDRALVQKYLEKLGTDRMKEAYNIYLESHGYPAAFKLEPEAENVAVEDAAKSEET